MVPEIEDSKSEQPLVEYYFQRWQDGKVYQFGSDFPDQPICSGRSGTCREWLNKPPYFGTFCACCRFQINADKAIRQAVRLGILTEREVEASAFG